jgi:hypothetical protein
MIPITTTALRWGFAFAVLAALAATTAQLHPILALAAVGLAGVVGFYVGGWVWLRRVVARLRVLTRGLT